MNMNLANIANISEENFKCLHCQEFYFMNSENKCVPSPDCGFGFYGETNTRTCTICDKSCLGCTGPYNYSCIKCNEKYFPTTQGNCEQTTCNNNNEYLDIDQVCQSKIIYIFIYICNLECDIKCMGCVGPRDSNCLSCISGYFSREIGTKEVKCTPCEEVTGYMTITDSITNERRCVEICGDGLNLGEYQCDDGNIKSGDGCSSECRVEEGYICIGGNIVSPDICKDITSPTLEATGKGINNTFYFAFSEPVEMMSTKSPKSFVNMTIRGEYEDYMFDYEIDFKKDNIGPRELVDVVNRYQTMIITLIPLSSIIKDDVIVLYIDIGADNILQLRYISR